MKVLTVVAMLVLLVASGLRSLPAEASNSIYSVKSLRMVCGHNHDPALKKTVTTMCQAYIRGILETWQLQHEVHKRLNTNSVLPAYCNTIFKVSDDEWHRIVQEALPSATDGLASILVIQAISTRLC